MNLLTYLTTTTNIWWFTIYPFIYEYLKKRYGNWNIAYPEVAMDNQIDAIISAYESELLKIKTLLENQDFITDFNKWVDDNQVLNNSNSTASQNATQNYSGFNVAGKFSEQDNALTNVIDSTTTNKMVNYLNQYLRLINSPIANIFINFSKEFEKLLILWYN